MSAQVKMGEVGVPGGQLHLGPLADSSNRSPKEPSPSTGGSLILSPGPSKPATAPKPHLTARPFSAQKNSSLRRISAPKPRPPLQPTQPAPFTPSHPATPGTQLPGTPRTDSPSAVSPESASTPEPETASTLKPALANAAKPDPASTHEPDAAGTPHSGPTKPETASSSKQFPPVKPKPDRPSIRKADPVSAQKQDDKSAPKKSPLVASKSEKSSTPKSEQPSTENPRPVTAKADVSKAILPQSPTPPQPEAGAESEASMGVPNKVEQEKQGPDSPAPLPTSPEPSNSSPVIYRARRPLSADLTSKFEPASRQESPHRPVGAPVKLEEGGAGVSPSEQKGSVVVSEGTSQKNEGETDRVQEISGGSIKKRISQLFDSAFSGSASAKAPPPEAEPQLAAQPIAEQDVSVDVKQRIRALTAESVPAPTTSPKPAFKPRPLSQDLTKCFAVEKGPGSPSSPRALEKGGTSWRPEETREADGKLKEKDEKEEKDRQEVAEGGRTHEVPSNKGLKPDPESLSENKVERVNKGGGGKDMRTPSATEKEGGVSSLGSTPILQAMERAPVARMEDKATPTVAQLEEDTHTPDTPKEMERVEQMKREIEERMERKKEEERVERMLEEKREKVRLEKEMEEKKEKERMEKEMMGKNEKGKIDRELEERREYERVEREMEEKRKQLRMKRDLEEMKAKERLEEKKEKERLEKEKEGKERLEKEMEEKREKARLERQLEEMRVKERVKKEMEEKEEKERIARMLEEQREKERLERELEERRERERLNELEEMREKERIERELEEMRERERMERMLAEKREKERLEMELEERMERERVKELEERREKERFERELEEKREKERLAKELEEMRERERMERILEEKREKERREMELEERMEREKLRKELEEMREKERFERELEERREKERLERELEEMREQERLERMLERDRENERVRRELEEMRENERLARELEDKREKERFERDVEEKREKERLAKELEEMRENERMERMLAEKREKERLETELEERMERERLKKELEEMRDKERFERELEERREKERLERELEEMREQERLERMLERDREKERVRRELEEMREKERLERELEEKREKERVKRELEEMRERERLARGLEERREKERVEKELEEERMRVKMETEMERESTSAEKESVKVTEPSPLGKSRVGTAGEVGGASELAEDIRFDDFSVKPRRWGTQGRTVWSHRDTPALWDERREEGEEQPWMGGEKEQQKEGGTENVPEREEALGTSRDWSTLGSGLASDDPSVRDSGNARQEPDETPPQPLTPPPSPPSLELLREGPKETEEEDGPELFVGTDPETLDNNRLTPVTPRTDDLINFFQIEPQPGEFDSLSNQDPDDAIDSTPDLEPEPEPLPEFSTSLLDSSAQLSKAGLGRRLNRNRPSMPSKSVSHQLREAADEPDLWRLHDSTAAVESSYGADSSCEAEPCSPVSQSQRVPMFPGMNPSALKAGLQKRGGDSEGKTDSPPPSVSDFLRRAPHISLPPPPQFSSPTLSSPQRSLSSKSPILPGAARVLPPAAGTEDRVEADPPWLQELKTKKRFHQPGADT